MVRLCLQSDWFIHGVGKMISRIFLAIFFIYIAAVVYVDIMPSRTVYGCSEDNLPKDIKSFCDAKLFRTKYYSTKPSKGVLQRTQQEQSPAVFREDSGIEKSGGRDGVEPSTNL